MKKNDSKKAVILYGSPGSGKGTQADLLVRRKDFIHFDTGRYVERLYRSPEAKTDPILKKEKKLFDTGFLNTPSWILGIVKRETIKIAKAGFSIVYSGSPRTMYEAFGDKKEKGLVETLGKLYGKENIVVIYLIIKEGTTLVRNSVRRVCSVCGLSILGKSKTSRCPFCDGLPRKRTLDDPKIIGMRLKEFHNRTKPILKKLKKQGYRIIKIDGERAPYLVHESVLRVVEATRKK